MKKLSLAVAVLSMAALFGMAALALAEGGKAAPSKAMTMEGYIIDTQCATANKDKLAEFAPTHSKDCATAPACMKSGYNLYSDGKLYKFDKKSSKKVSEFLGKADSTLHVKAEVVHEKGGALKLVSIENAK